MSSRRVVIANMLWLVAVCAGSFGMMKYANTPGPATQTPRQWPATSVITHDVQQDTLVMFVHPRCPCSRASLGELSLLMTSCQNRLSAHVLFYKPTGAPNEWAQTDLWRSASAIPGVTVGYDDGGVEARRFRAETSGQTVLYDPAGRLQFSGGITAARGHAGDNAGRSTLVALLHGETTAADRTPVYGCSLVTPAAPNSQVASLCQKP